MENCKESTIQELGIGTITLSWSKWFPWNEIKVDSRSPGGIYIPNKKSGVYEAKYVNEEERLTIGKATDLRHRIRQCLVKGISKHSTGDKIRFNEDVSNIVVRWAETSRPCASEEELHKIHRIQFGNLPKHVDRT